MPSPPSEPPSALGVIPARGGSKGLPAKNLRPLLDEPLIAHTIRAAEGARRLTKTVVSTDSDEIAEVATAQGAEVVRRPADLAADDSPTEDALMDAVETLERAGEPEPDYVVTLEPTSPLRTSALIDECLDLAAARDADAVVTLAESRESWGRLADGRFALLLPGQPRRRQDREPLYRESGTVWVTRTSVLRANRSVLAGTVFGVVVPEEEAVDIHTELDLALAETLMRARREAER